MQENKLQIYTIRVYQGKPTYDENAKLTSENHLVKLEYNTRQFDLFIKNARTFYTRIDVVKATDGKDEIEINPEIKKRLEDCVKAVEKPLTPEQQKIKDLEEKLALLMNGAKHEAKSEPKKEVVQEDETELEVARLKYMELFGKKPSHLMKLDTLNEKINEKLNS